MPRLALALLFFVAACSAQPASPTLQEGTWTGGLTPMNHPDMVMPLTYEVSRAAGDLTITIVNQDLRTAARDVRIDGDTLRFVFNEPEGDVALTCALGRQPGAGYAGRCTDAAGKWARFTMER